MANKIALPFLLLLLDGDEAGQKSKPDRRIFSNLLRRVGDALPFAC